MDMGCHAIEFFRWMLGRPRIKSVYAQMSTSLHGARTRGEDNAILLLEFEGGATAIAEESWTKPGGMDDRAEVYGTQGVAYADLLHGNAIETYSAVGYDYAVEKAGATKGWSFTVYEEAWNYGFHGEMAHFVDCVQNDRKPLVTGEDGRAVLEAVMAAYESAREGRKVPLPFETPAVGGGERGHESQSRAGQRSVEHDRHPEGQPQGDAHVVATESFRVRPPEAEEEGEGEKAGHDEEGRRERALAAGSAGRRALCRLTRHETSVLYFLDAPLSRPDSTLHRRAMGNARVSA